MAVLVAGALLGGGVIVLKQMRTSQYRSDMCASIRALNAGRHDDVPVATGERSVVVIGDSYGQGSGLDDPREQSWSTLAGRQAGWTTHVDAVGSTGFTNEGYCGGQEFAARVDAALAQTPDLVIVQGGLNDDTADSAALSRQAGDLLRRLNAVPAVAVIGPPDVPARQHEAATDAVLREATKAAGRRYISMLDVPMSLLPDQLHMTPEGHEQFAALVVAAAQ